MLSNAQALIVGVIGGHIISPDEIFAELDDGEVTVEMERLIEK